MYDICFVYTTDNEKSSDLEPSDLTLDQRQLMKRYHFIEKIKISEIIGLLIGTFSIERYNLALKYATKLIRKNNKKPILCHMGQVTPQKLANLPEVDIWVQICEPRNIIIDQKEFYAPICGFRELLVAFGEKDFLEEKFDFNELIPDDLDISEKIREIDLDHDGEEEEKNEETLLPSLIPGKQLATRPKNEVAVGDAVTNYLVSRVWTGLEVGEGKIEPAELSKGLDGYAAGYKNE